ncbi:hypothetical protein CPLU01_00214 [Colletotrichum plurivorum]|uniref:Uncharacterized protein n=1 Tax=Colletotrichum plurivorum TaxID=2175906 RepID=A0A8H6U6P3_9PEZI|nr:hypothetical protein CPLU01_00214 [Colletotrichum plurivorum]
MASEQAVYAIAEPQGQPGQPPMPERTSTLAFDQPALGRFVAFAECRAPVAAGPCDPSAGGVSTQPWIRTFALAELPHVPLRGNSTPHTANAFDLVGEAPTQDTVNWTGTARRVCCGRHPAQHWLSYMIRQGHVCRTTGDLGTRRSVKREGEEREGEDEDEDEEDEGEVVPQLQLRLRLQPKWTSTRARDRVLYLMNR